MFSVPFYFQIVHPVAFFRNIAHLRKSAVRRAGAGFPGLFRPGLAVRRGGEGLHPRRVPLSESVQAEVVEDFGPWADDVWEAAKRITAFAPCATPPRCGKCIPRRSRNCVRLKISAQGRPIGWSVLMNTALSGHAHFGNMRLGSIVDCFAAPRDAAHVLDRSREYLVRQGVDLIVSNQSHRVWRAGLSGFAASFPGRPIFSLHRRGR